MQMLGSLTNCEHCAGTIDAKQNAKPARERRGDELVV